VLTRIALLAVVLGVVGCGGVALPDPDSRGAVVLRTRCDTCHRVYAPGSMTLEMWKLQVARMRGEFARRGMPWLAPDDEQALMDYLAAHAGTS
jgi:hypothetical protein